VWGVECLSCRLQGHVPWPLLATFAPDDDARAFPPQIQPQRPTGFEGYRVYNLGFAVWGLWYRVSGLGYRGFRV
jgi:hypothetical protein